MLIFLLLSFHWHFSQKVWKSEPKTWFHHWLFFPSEVCYTSLAWSSVFMCGIFQTQIYKVTNASIGVGVHMTVIKSLPRLSALLEPAYLIFTVPWILMDNRWDDTGPAPGNHRNHFGNCFPVARACLSLNSLVILEDGMSQSCGEKRGRGANQEKMQGNSLGGQNEKVLAKVENKVTVICQLEQNIKQGKFGS